MSIFKKITKWFTTPLPTPIDMIDEKAATALVLMSRIEEIEQSIKELKTLIDQLKGE